MLCAYFNLFDIRVFNCDLCFYDQGTTVVDNLLDSDDIHYMLEALKTLGLKVEDDKSTRRVIVEGCGGLFPVGKESKDEVQLFLGNAGTAMRPLTAALVAAGGNSRSIYSLWTCSLKLLDA